ncbi:unnamed protein product [Blepharisma stoltei]|uniref:Phosphatidic acid phosphatase type 2/haloperoxidase domain-containing protein n=1 Tax=Blepharisma stoltei TaxID=1481888 RepID=A0AAU9ICV2_9CILI|nr:unnamed protein product [Blepharisma stoltei]
MKAVIITGGIAVVCTLLEVYMEDLLEDTSADFIEWLQGGSNSFWNFIFQALEIITAGIFIFISAIIYICGNRKLGVMGLTAGIFAACLASLFKMCFCHPRPLWKYSKINAIKCHTDFGAPSGHTFSGGAIIFYLGYFWLKNGQNIITKVFLLIFAILITGVDRTYLGVHFYFQVVLGYSYAAFLSALLMRTSVERFMNKLMKNIKHVIIVNVSAVFFVIVAVFLYLFRNPAWDETWTINFKNDCNRDLTSKDALFKNLTDTTLAFAIAGLLLGYYKIRDMRTYSGLTRDNFIISIIGIAVLAAVILGVEKIVGMIALDFVKIILYCASRFLAGFVVGYFIPSLLSKINKKRPTEQLILSEDLKLQLIKIDDKS